MSRQTHAKDNLTKESTSDGVEERYNGDIDLERGASVPADSTAGYAIGARYIKLNGGEGTTLFINEGTTTSCDFNAV